MKTTIKSCCRTASRDANQSKSTNTPTPELFLGSKALSELRILMRLASSGPHRDRLAGSR
jgi:hypothetical protein